MTRLFNEAKNAQDDNMSFHKMPREGVRSLNKSLQGLDLGGLAKDVAEIVAPVSFRVAKAGAKVAAHFGEKLIQNFDARANNAPSGPALH